jgi:hypothetical protein
MIIIKKYILALVMLILGTILGIILLELILIGNLGLLLHGMAMPTPKDLPLINQFSDIHYSDGDVVVLGRSISLGAHIQKPWPELLAEITGDEVNLSQPGSNIDLKTDYLTIFEINHNPEWVILEVAPKIDIVDNKAPKSLLSQRLLSPMIQSIWRRYNDNKKTELKGTEIYPIIIDLPGRTCDLTCCIHFMEFYTQNREIIEASQDRIIFKEKAKRLIKLAEKNSACTAILFVPTKPDVYFQFVADHEQLIATHQNVFSYGIGEEGYLEISGAAGVNVEKVQYRAFAGRDVIQSFTGMIYL